MMVIIAELAAVDKNKEAMLTFLSTQHLVAEYSKRLRRRQVIQTRVSESCRLVQGNDDGWMKSPPESPGRTALVMQAQ